MRIWNELELILIRFVQRSNDTTPLIRKKFSKKDIDMIYQKLGF